MDTVTEAALKSALFTALLPGGAGFIAGVLARRGMVGLLVVAVGLLGALWGINGQAPFVPDEASEWLVLGSLLVGVLAVVPAIPAGSRRVVGAALVAIAGLLMLLPLRASSPVTSLAVAALIGAVAFSNAHTLDDRSPLNQVLPVAWMLAGLGGAIALSGSARYAQVLFAIAAALGAAALGALVKKVSVRPVFAQVGYAGLFLGLLMGRYFLDLAWLVWMPLFVAGLLAGFIGHRAAGRSGALGANAAALIAAAISLAVAYSQQPAADPYGATY